MELVAVAAVARESFLVPDRDAFRYGLELGRVDPARALAQQPTDPSVPDARGLAVAESLKIADRLDAHRAQPRIGTWTRPRQEPHGKGREEARLATRRDNHEAAGLAPIAGDLRDDLARSHADRAGEARGPSDCRLYRF